MLGNSRTKPRHRSQLAASVRRKQHAMNETEAKRHCKRGVVGVILRKERLLIIRRSLTVIAPGLLCLPGGGIEPGETEAEALVREMREELTIEVQPVRLCFRSVTDWGTELAWWLARLEEHVTPIANPDEVAEVHWMTGTQIRSTEGMRPSLPTFLDALERGEIDLQG